MGKTWALMLLTVVCGQFLAAAELAVNGGFDGAQPDSGWNLPSPQWKALAGKGRKGTGGLVWENADPKSFMFPTQRLALEPGASYVISGWAKVVEGTPKPSICIGWCDASNKWISCQYAERQAENDPSTEGWVRYEARTPSLPANAAIGILHCHVRRGDVGKVLFDDISLESAGVEVIPYLATSAFRNSFTADDGDIAFVAPLNLNVVKTPLETLRAELVFRDASGRKVSRPADAFAADLVRFDVPAGDFAIGRQGVRLQIVVREDGRVLAAKERMVERTVVPRPRRVRFDRKGRTLIDGRPVFPLGCFSARVDPDMMADYRKGPFNFVMPYGLTEAPNLDCAASNGVYVAPCIVKRVYGLKYQMVDTRKMTREEAHASLREYVGRVKDHPALAAWYLVDEVPLADVAKVADINDLMEELDPDHPTWAVTDKPHHARPLLACYDVIGMDPYPIGNLGWRNDVGICSGWAQEARKGMYGFRPMWHVPQAFSWEWYRKDEIEVIPDKRMPNRREIANMTWQGVAGGANGIFFYSYSAMRKYMKPGDFESSWRDVCDVAREVKAMEDVLLSDGDPVVVVDPGEKVAVRTWRQAGRDWVLVANRTREAVRTSFALPRAYAVLETRCGEGVTLAGDRLEVDFAPFGYAFVALMTAEQGQEAR